MGMGSLRRRETGHPRQREPGEIGNKFCNIAQFVQKEKAGTRSTRYGKREIQTPCTNPLPIQTTFGRASSAKRRYPSDIVNLSDEFRLSLEYKESSNFGSFGNCFMSVRKPFKASSGTAYSIFVQYLKEKN